MIDGEKLEVFPLRTKQGMSPPTTSCQHCEKSQLMQQDKEIQGILIGKENNKTAFACRCHLYTKSERTVKKKNVYMQRQKTQNTKLSIEEEESWRTNIT